MPKVKTSASNRKLTVAGYESCADSLREKFPHIAEEISTEQGATDLDFFLGRISRARRIHLLEKQISLSVLNPHSFAEMESPVLPCRTKGVVARCMDAVHPVGTMEWTFEVFPELRAHVCEFLLAADEMEDMVRDLTAGYNYVGVDPEDLNDILFRSNHLCKKLSLFSRINEQRLRVMAKIDRTNKPRRINPGNDKEAA